ncbi:MAG: hypothetical protein FJ276_02490 [Planctomycetes bacterium]|nr:hypothetical protein [Planctomycetota bacterium]
MASDNNLGDLGPREGDPVYVHWGWYYSLPGLAMWIVLAVLLVVPKHNRTFHAWLILVLPLSVSALALLTRPLFSVRTVELDGVEVFACAFAGAWAGVWLLGPWLSHGGRVRVSALTLVAMFAFGVVGYVGYFGFWVSDELLLPLFLSWTVCSVALVAAMALIGWSCRKICGLPQLLLWPVVWLPLVCLSCVGIGLAIVFVIEQDTDVLSEPSRVLIPLAAISTSLACGLYVFNLPVMLLSALNPCYEQRFRSRYCPSAESQRTPAVPPPVVQNHTDNPFGF